MEELFSLAHQYPNIVYLYALLGNIIFAFIQICFKKAAQILTPFQILAIRSSFLTLINLVMLKKQKKSAYILSPKIFKIVLIRITIVALSNAATYYSIKYVPISLANTILNTGPIIIFLIESYHYKKPIKLVNFVLAILSFIGIIFIIQPQFIFEQQNSHKIQNLQFYIFLLILSAFAMALNNHFIHNLAKKVEPIINIHYSYIGMLFVTSLLGNIQPATMPRGNINFHLVFLLFAIIILTFGGQYLIIVANTLRKPSHMMPFGYAGVATGFLADIYMFDIDFTYLSMIGVFLTSGGLFSEYLISRSPTDSKPKNAMDKMIHQNDDIHSDLDEKREKK